MLNKIIRIENCDTKQYFYTLDHCQEHGLGSNWVSIITQLPIEVTPRPGVEHGLVTNLEEYETVFNKDYTEIPNPDINMRTAFRRKIRAIAKHDCNVILATSLDSLSFNQHFVATGTCLEMPVNFIEINKHPKIKQVLGEMCVAFDRGDGFLIATYGRDFEYEEICEPGYMADVEHFLNFSPSGFWLTPDGIKWDKFPFPLKHMENPEIRIFKEGSNLIVHNTVYLVSQCPYIGDAWPDVILFFEQFKDHEKVKKSVKSFKIDLDDHDCCADGYINIKNIDGTTVYTNVPFNHDVHEYLFRKVYKYKEVIKE